MQLCPAAKCTSKYCTRSLPTHPTMAPEFKLGKWKGCPVVLDNMVSKRNKFRH